jgi:hypothetical protein
MNLINASDNYISGIKMLSELLTQEWDSEEEKEKFAIEIVQHIAGNEKTIVSKIVNIKSFMDDIQFACEKARSWKKSIDAQIKSAENLEKRLKEYVLNTLKIIESQTGQKEIVDSGVKITYQKQGIKEPVVIDDESLVPNKMKKYTITIESNEERLFEIQEFLRGQSDAVVVKIENEPDKDKLREALKSGNIGLGAHIAPQAEGIRIKSTIKE